ncbi:hypothetical protein J437_LFUL009715 [Ladona fulva]|uniref:Uncharacterized protein n=1 Tax=Ladona fulva TaxID=123851 RepID=A0A8K0K674_LADFU|nr:hypothetical protein J437_LFUL009715 [Ladona fulva]
MNKLKSMRKYKWIEKSSKKRILQSIDSCIQNSTGSKGLIQADKRPIGEHECHFNAPQVNEVAVITVDSEYTSHDILLVDYVCKNRDRTNDIHMTEPKGLHTEEYICLRDTIMDDINVDDIGRSDLTINLLRKSMTHA